MIHSPTCRLQYFVSIWKAVFVLYKYVWVFISLISSYLRISYISRRCGLARISLCQMPQWFCVGTLCPWWRFSGLFWYLSMKLEAWASSRLSRWWFCATEGLLRWVTLDGGLFVCFFRVFGRWFTRRTLPPQIVPTFFFYWLFHYSLEFFCLSILAKPLYVFLVFYLFLHARTANLQRVRRLWTEPDQQKPS